MDYKYWFNDQWFQHDNDELLELRKRKCYFVR